MAFVSRHVLFLSTRIFDLIGLISLIIVTAKVIMQRLWEIEIAWRGEILEKMRTMWKIIWTHLCILRNSEIPRNISFGNGTTIEIHGI